MLLFIRAQNTDVSREAYSTTSSAEVSTDGGIVSPRALAVLEIDDLLEARGFLDWQIPRFCAS